MSGNRLQSKCLMFGLEVSMCVFTDWPWETVSKTIYYIMNKGNDAGTHPKLPGCLTQNYWIVITPLRLIFILSGMVFQLMTCFRRDRISTDLVQIANTTTKQLSCDKKNEILGGLLLPDLVIFLLACWVYFVLKFGYRNRECLQKCLGWEEMSAVLEADGAENLDELVKAVKSKLSKPLVIGYTVIPILYILSSQLLSVWYLFAFHLIDEDVGIRTPLGGHFLTGHVKTVFLALTFVGFIALDLLYLTVIMRYVYRCQMIIYYLQLILDKVENRKYKTQNEAMEEVKKAKEFIKHLNASSGTTGFITLIAVFNAANCAFILSNDITFSQAPAIALRLTLWGFLAIFPFYKAAGLNVTSKRIRATGLCMRIPAPVFVNDHQTPENGHRLNEGYIINLKAKVFGIPVRPWLPYLVIIILLLTIILESRVGRINIPYKPWH